MCGNPTTNTTQSQSMLPAIHRTYAIIPITMPKPKTTPRKPAPKKPAPPAIDFNKVMALAVENTKGIAELRKAGAKTDNRMREHDNRMREHDERMADLGVRIAQNHKSILDLRKSTADLRASDAELRASNAELRQSIEGLGQFLAQLDIRIAQIAERAAEALAVAQENNKYIGTHANGEAEMLEIECYNTLLKMGEINGVKLERLRLGMKDPQYGVEIDLVGINGKVTFPMEVKRTLYPEDVLRFKEVQVERFKEAYPEYALNKQVTPVIIFALRKQKNNKGKKEDPVQLALKAGMIVLQSTGENQLSPITAPAQVIARSPKDKD